MILQFQKTSILFHPKLHKGHLHLHNQGWTRLIVVIVLLSINTFAFAAPNVGGRGNPY